MKLYTDIVTDYLAGRSLAAHAQEWFFTQPGYCFQEPDGSDAQKAAVMQVYEQVLRTVETQPAQQQEQLHSAVFGSYYNKYACMCGLYYLARCWQGGGSARLAEEFAAGWQGFAEKTLS